jgi:hypothetical protein
MTIPVYPETLSISIDSAAGGRLSAPLTPTYRKKPADHCGPECLYSAEVAVGVK